MTDDNKTRVMLHDTPEQKPALDKPPIDLQNIGKTLNNWLDALFGILKQPFDAIRSQFPPGSFLAQIFGRPDDMSGDRYRTELKMNALLGPQEKPPAPAEREPWEQRPGTDPGAAFNRDIRDGARDSKLEALRGTCTGIFNREAPGVIEMKPLAPSPEPDRQPQPS